MKKRYTIIYLLFCMLGVLNVAAQTSSIEDYVEGKIRIKVKEKYLLESTQLKSSSVSGQANASDIVSIDNLNNALGITRIERVFPFSVKNESKHRKYGLHLWFELSFDPSMNPDNIVDQFSVLNEVELAKPIYKKVSLQSDKKPIIYKAGELQGQPRSASNNVVLKATNIEVVEFDDPMLSQQWHYENDGEIGGVKDQDIDLFQAWQKATGDSSIVVAIVDGGIDFKHEDLAEAMWVNQAELDGEEGVDDDGNGYIDDIYGTNFVFGGSITPHNHGTHVAGTVGAVNNNGVGVAGVAGGDGKNKGVRLMSCQVFDNRASSSGNFAAAIVYGADNGAIISQNSWGYSKAGYYEPEVYDAVKYFIAEAGQYEGSPMIGGILFFAAGNTGIEETHYPGTFDEVIAVASSGPDGQAAVYSTYGDWVDITAPGGDQFVHGLEGGVLSTMPGNEYGWQQGTSMACPHVSGVAALIIDQFGGDDFTAEDCRNIILGSTSPLSFNGNGKFGIGTLNAATAVAEDERIAPDAVGDLASDEIYHNAIKVKWTVPKDSDNFQPSVFHLALSDKAITKDNFNNATIFSFTSGFDAGTAVNVTISDLSKQTDYWFAIKSADVFSNLSEISNILHVKTTNEPFFSMSTTSIKDTIDVSAQTLINVPVTFSNVGEGIVKWENYVINERIYFVKEEEIAEDLEDKEAEAVMHPELFVHDQLYNLDDASNGGLKSASTNLPVNLPDHFYLDNTIGESGMTHNDGSSAVGLIGSGISNAGLVLATRYSVDYDLTFNLTHIQMGLFPSVKDDPIIIELRKGSKDIKTAERVYLQEYYVDTTDVYKNFTVPLYEPQRFEDGELFWVILHFPKEHVLPMAVSHQTWMKDIFMMSFDGGRTYTDMQYKNSKPYVPMMSLLSSGDDGSYVFLDPESGEIKAGEQQLVDVKLDATHLTNGNHIASVTLVTNDVAKAYVNMEVLLHVKGQVSELSVDDEIVFTEYNATTLTNTIPLTNKGYGVLEVYDITSATGTFDYSSTDTITIYKDVTKNIEFSYQPSGVGTFNETIQLVTNEGVKEVNLIYHILEAATADISLSSNELTLAYEQSGNLDVTITNTGVNSDLIFDLNRYDGFNNAKGILANKLNYDLITSDDPGGPQPGSWEDIQNFSYKLALSETIEEYDTLLALRDLNLYDFDLGFEMPFYNELFEQMYVASNGNLYFYSSEYYADELPMQSEFHQGVVSPLFLKSVNTRIQSVESHSYGDRFVINLNMLVIGINNSDTLNVEYSDATDVTYQTQVIMHRDGSIDFHYINVDEVVSKCGDYHVAIVGLEPDDFKAYRNISDVNNIVKNDMVIRYTPQVKRTYVSSVSSLGGVINSGDEEVVSIVFNNNPSPVAGSYLQEFVVETNTSVGEVILPFTLHITGNADYEAQDTVVFSSTKLNSSSQEVLSINNIGSDLGSVSGITFDNNEFTCSAVFPLVLNAKANDFLLVEFTPTSVGEKTSTATITYSNGTVEKVVIESIAARNPEFTHTIPASIDVNVRGGESVNVAFEIDAQDTGTDLDVLGIGGQYAQITKADKLNAFGETSEHINDLYGYSWFIGDSTRVYHKWNDISDDYELLNINSGEQKVVALPFEFPFYGEMYDTLWVSVNGYVTVIEPEQDELNLEFKKDDGMAGMIAPFHTSLKAPSSNDGVKMRIDNDRIFLQYDNFLGANTNSSGGAISFQLEIVNDGRIYFHYRDVEQWGGLLNYGLEHPDETEVLEHYKTWILTWTDIQDSTSIVILPPSVSEVKSGAKATYNVKVNADNIYKPGTYQDTVSIKTNSSTTPFINVPIVLNVTGQPIVKVQDDVIWHDVIYAPNKVIRKSIKITNVGHDVLEINAISGTDIPGFELYDNNDAFIVRSGTGTLLKAIEINPWEDYLLTVQVDASNPDLVNGEMLLKGNAATQTVQVKASFVETPTFNWSAIDQTLEVNNTDKKTYEFSISNSGDTDLDFKVFSAIVPAIDTNIDSISDVIGEIQLEYPLVVDSLYLDKPESIDGLFTPFIGGQRLVFCNKYTAPENGFFITHIQVMNYLHSSVIDEYSQIMIYVDGDEPLAGTKVCEQNFLVDQAIDQEWTYYPLDNPVSVNPGQNFWVLVSNPLTPSSLKNVGFNSTKDPDLLERSWIGSYLRGGGYWLMKSKDDGINMIWKIRPLTAAGDGQWISLNINDGQLAGGADTTVVATIESAGLEGGTYRSKIIAKSNDINTPNASVIVDISVNGSPQILHRPNSYQDTLRVTELEKVTWKYLVEDPENDAIKLSVVNHDLPVDLNFSQTSDNEAELSFRTDINSSGKYFIEVSVLDSYGNNVKDSVHIRIADVNRAPEFNTEYGIIRLNIAAEDPVFVIDPGKMFSDPDGDQMQILAGNYTPEIVDMALGSNYIDIHPLSEGTGYLVFGADDGNEGGFTVAEVYVVVINDPDAISANPDGIGLDEEAVLKAGNQMLIYPNPSTNGVTKVVYEIENEGDVEVAVVDIYGQKVYTTSTLTRDKGVYAEEINTDKLMSGMYLCRVIYNGVAIDTQKLIVK